jgi:hypothetical protein
VLRTRAPRKLLPFRLACIRPAASVHPEPGSNSPSYVALPPPIAGWTCILNVCRSVDFIMLSNNFKELKPGAIPLATWHPASVPSKRVAKVIPFFDPASVYLCFFSWWLEIRWKNIPSPLVQDPCRPLRGCKGTNIPLIRNTFKEKNMRKFEKNGKQLEFSHFKPKVF